MIQLAVSAALVAFQAKYLSELWDYMFGDGEKTVKFALGLCGFLFFCQLVYLLFLLGLALAGLF